MLLACASVAAGGAGAADEVGRCDPVPVKKAVKTVRREIKVALIGADRPVGPKDMRDATPEGCFAYWKRWMDREIANKPDLVVLPEGCVSYRGYGPEKKRQVVRRFGDRLLKMFQSYAREHACYLSFNGYRERSDGRFGNTSFFMDREGDVIAVYDKVYPTPEEIEWKEFPIVPGEGPVVVDTDFGRVGFATCFDLNFRDLIEAYAREKPAVICFQSAYDGDFWRRVWSYTCRAYLVSCTVGNLAKEIDGPSGEVLMHSHNYFFTSTTKINTNCRVIHLDDNWGGIQKAIDTYGDRFEMRNPGAVGAVTVLSNDPAKPIDEIVREFGLILWDDYYARSVRLRGGPVSGEIPSPGASPSTDKKDNQP